MTEREAGVDNTRSVVVVLGMHRSGTSLLASVVRALGVQLGGELVPADQHNPAGYFEHGDIVRIHRQLIDRLDRRWTGPKGTLPYPDRFWESVAGKAAGVELRGILESALARDTGVWGFKDPRTSRLLPLWKTLFRESSVRPIYLLAVRSPASVQGSVTRRDGLSPARAQLLWLLHNLAVVHDTWGENIAVFDYDQWFSGPKEQARRLRTTLAELPGIRPDDLDHELDELIRPDLRHNQEGLENAIPFINETYVGLLEAIASGRIPGRLLEIDAEVRRAIDLLRAWSEVVGDMPPQPAPVAGKTRRRWIGLHRDELSRSKG